jgi:hypothetical protein
LNPNNNIFRRYVFVEKYVPSKNRIVTIKKCSGELYWYKSHIGKSFIVREFLNIKDCSENLNVDTFLKVDVEKIVSSKFLVLFSSSFDGDLAAEFSSGHIIEKRDCEVIF